MFTPQQLSEVGFTKAVFGGYDMDSVHTVLDPLIEDFTTLYKENAVLKSKLRILVEKLEEYRRLGMPVTSAEQAKVADEAAQDIVRNAENKAARIISDARIRAEQIMSDTKKKTPGTTGTFSAELQAEEERLARARQAAADFIQSMEAELRQHQALLDSLKQANLPMPVKKQDAPSAKAPVVPAQASAAAAEKPAAEGFLAMSDDIAMEIAQNLEKQLGTVPKSTFDASEQDTKVLRPLHPESITAKFGDLQFGKNYNPKH